MTDLFAINVTQHVYSTVPGRVGNWIYQTTIKLPWVPGPDAWICFTRPDGVEYLTERVKDVIVSTERIHVCLRNVSTDSGELLDEMDAQGWEKLGGPWKDQTP